MDKVSENPFKNREHENTSLLVATALFVALYLKHHGRKGNRPFQSFLF